MTDAAERLADPEFQRLLERRSRWRWGLSGVLIVAYLAYGIGGVYFAEAFGRPVFGSSLPLGMALGYLIIFASIVLSVVYVRAVNRLEEGWSGGAGGDD